MYYVITHVTGDALCSHLLRAIAMTACDLCAMTKSWEVQEEVVKVIHEEFYAQVTSLHDGRLFKLPRHVLLF
jgi:hypothetical protein